MRVTFMTERLCCSLLLVEVFLNQKKGHIKDLLFKIASQKFIHLLEIHFIIFTKLSLIPMITCIALFSFSYFNSYDNIIR